MLIPLYFDVDERADTPDPAPVEPPKTLTQDEVNALLGKTRKDAQATAVNKLLGELGFDKPDDLKALVTEARARKDAELSEVEKAQKALAEREARIAALEADKAALETARRIDARDRALAAAMPDAFDADDVIAWAARGASDALAAAVKDDGTIDTGAIERVIAAARKAKPHLFKPTGAGSPSNASAAQTPTAKFDKPLFNW